MKRTLQFQRTDRGITEAFVKLIVEKQFERITVQDIMEEAMVTRSTFYQHFPDKYAILEQLQAKYITDMTNQVDSIMSLESLSLELVDQLMAAYFVKNRNILKVLVKIKTEHVDIVKQWQEYFEQYFHRNSAMSLSHLDASMLAGFFVNFFIYYLEHENLEGNYSTMLFQCTFRLTLAFFNLGSQSEAEAELLKLIAKFTGTKQ